MGEEAHHIVCPTSINRIPAGKDARRAKPAVLFRRSESRRYHLPGLSLDPQSMK